LFLREVPARLLFQAGRLPFAIEGSFSLLSGEIMYPATVVRGALLAVGLLAGAMPARAQTEVGADLGLFSSYVWRGLSLTNKPVAQPAVWASIPAGSAAITLGLWSTIDLGKYDDVDDDISESGGTSSFNLAEYDPYAEVAFTVGKASLTGGVTAYIYPNDAGFTKDLNTVEVYGKAALEAPLSPFINIYYDVDKVKGAYFEGGVSHSLQASEKVSIDLGATAGFNAGQGSSDDDPSFNFADDGFTHLDLSAGVPFTAGAFSISPVVHLIIAGDDATKVQSPSNLDAGAKVWGGVSIGWSKALGAEAAEPEPTSQP
jgi:hypothetical protein